MNTIKKINRTALESINFVNPTQDDADKLQNILWEANVRPTYAGFFHSNNDKLLAYNWRVTVEDETLVLAYTYKCTRPFKKTVELNSYVIEFLSEDCFLACRPGGILIYEHNLKDKNIWEQAITPIKEALGFEYNRDGECLRHGTESYWRD